MLYGISGASGTGKTTLAKRVADDLGITYLSGSITETARKHGFDAVGLLPLDKRIELQIKLLEDHIAMIGEAGRPAIVDRTPIDMIAYLMAEFDMHSHRRATAEELQHAANYVELALDATAKLYDHIFVVGILDHYEEADTRPKPNPAYQMHTQLLMQGATSRLWGRVNLSIMPMQDLEARADFVHDRIVKRLDDISKERASSAHIH